MGVLGGLGVRLRALLRGDRVNRELDDEIRFHLELETEKHLREGVPPHEARRRALVAFGGVQRTREAHREVRGGVWLETVAADARFALRTLLRAPALTGAALLTIALGVGANTAIFSAVQAVLLRPLPFPAPERLVALWETNPERGWTRASVAPANALDWEEQVEAFESLALYSEGASRATLIDDGEPRLVRTIPVSGRFFDVLGVRPMIGRTFVAEETWNTGAAVMVLGERFWRDVLGSDSAIVGRTIELDGRALQVVGIMPRGFSYPADDVDAWTAFGWDPADRAQVWFRRAHFLRAIARVRPDASLDEARAELALVVRRLQHDYPETNRVMGAGFTPLHEFLVGDTRAPLLVLLAAATLLLLIACANVGNLLLVRATERARELSLRLALGAGRGRLARQALTEGLVLSLLGGAAGLALGWWGTRALMALQPPGMLRVREVGMDATVFVYVLAITTASGFLFGMVPALWSTRRAPAEALQAGGRSGSAGRRVRRWGDALVVGEVALALLLAVGAGLLVRSYSALRAVDPGFEPAGVLAATMYTPVARYDSLSRAQAFYERLVERVRALPGVDGAALVSQLPLEGLAWTGDFSIAGRPPGQHGTEVAVRSVSPDYFRTMRVPVLSGRPFTDDDRFDAPRVAVVNEALARAFFPAGDAVGQRIALDRVPDSTSTWWTIVGVVGSEHQTSPATPPRIEILAPFAQRRQYRMSLVVRTPGDPLALAPAVRRAVAELDPKLAIAAMEPMKAVHAGTLARDRFLMTLLLAFAVVGLGLAVVGVYGVLAQLTRGRSREMGIRIALGAPVSGVRWLVVGHGLRLTMLGLLIGAGAALLATRAIRGLLFGVLPADPVTFAAVGLVLAATSLVASYGPARKASRSDPVAVMRGE